MRRVVGTGVAFSLLAPAMLAADAGAASVGAWADRRGDAVFPDADLVSLAMRYEDDDSVTIGFGASVLVGGDRVDLFADTDLNSATGWHGADVAFYYEQFIQGQALLTGVWNGAAFQLVTPRTLLYSVTENAVAMSITRAELGATAGIRMFARGGHANIVGSPGSRYSDLAPDAGTYVLPFTSVGGARGEGTIDETSPAPASPGTPPRSGVTTPAVAFTVARAFLLPSNRRCLTRPPRLTLAPRTAVGATVERVEVWIDSKRVIRRSGRAARRSVTLRRLPTRRFTLRVRVTPQGGPPATATTTYRVCT
jgi:hypothetical protein